MIGFLIGFGFGFGLHYAWCKWGKDCDCDQYLWSKIKK